MKKIIHCLALVICPLLIIAQSVGEPKDSSWVKIYRASNPKINDLLHTKLDVRFDYDKAWMYGKEWLTLQPHFYPTDSLTLDAKGMDINEISLINGTAKKSLKYKYDGLQLKITLDKSYKGGENYTLYIDYISKPNDLKVKGSTAISDAKGLYFINPKGEIKDKPIQIWTQGETEANSAWMPTIDKPNQKSTEEIYMTVPSKYVTLSNGLLVNQKKNADGTRTDYWKMNLPHAPYLFFMAVGDFSIIKDYYKGKEVNYYVEKNQAPYAKGVFGLTPEMMRFFSDKLGVEYPWSKYSQIVGRDYVSGAMENTSATLHQESAYQNARQLTDGNSWENIICHELFHQWFGDLVTCESWSNITVNESMADYSETLWTEFKHGKDAGDEENQIGLIRYLGSPKESKKDLVRFKYADKEDVFDLVSYQKGGRVHQMLRNYVGENAYYKSLNNYLTTNKFKTGESAQMRLAFEEVTGQDMNWFWNQWFYGSGHPIVKIDYKYDDIAKKVSVIIEQTQKTDKIFRLPIAIDIYNGGTKKRYTVWVENKTNTFTFPYSQKPDLVNVDADKVMLWEKTDDKTAENYIFQFKQAPLYLDRKEALDYFSAKEMKELALGLNDKYAPLRKSTIENLEKSKFANDAAIISAVENNVNTEKDKKTKAAALHFLVGTKDLKYQSLYNNNVNDSSYSVSAAALQGLVTLDPDNAYLLAKKYSNDMKGDLTLVVFNILAKNGAESDFDFMNDFFEKVLPKEKFPFVATFCSYLEKINNNNNLKKGIDSILKFRKLIPEQYKIYTEPAFKASLDQLGKAKGGEIAEYIVNGMR